MKLGTHGLPRRSAVIARRRRRLHIALACLALGILLFIASVGFLVWQQPAELVVTAASALSTSASPAEPIATGRPARPVYREPVVERGADSQQVVAAVVRRDQPLHAPDAGPLDEAETDADSLADARTDASGLSHVPFMQAWSGSYAGGSVPDGASPAFGFPSAGPHLWAGGGAGSGSFGGGSSSDPGAGIPAAIPGSGDGGGKSEVPFVPLGDPGHATTTGDTQSTTGDTTGNPTGETSGFTTSGTTGTTGETTGTTTTGETTGTTTTGETGTTTGTTGTTTGTTSGDTTGETMTSGTTTGISIGETTGDTTGDGKVPSVPEPATLTLLGLGACGVVARAWRARRT